MLYLSFTSVGRLNRSLAWERIDAWMSSGMPWFVIWKKPWS